MPEDRTTGHPEIPGYTYGTQEAARSPVSLEELALLERTVGLTVEDERHLRMAGDVLAGQAEEMVDALRAVLSAEPHLARYSAAPDGSRHEAYSAASHPRFSRWIIDVCTRPHDQAWLDYQHEIGLRHTRARKNLTDGVESAEDHIPLRYLLAFVPVVLLITRDFLARKGHDAAEVQAMHSAWSKAVMLHVTLWTRPYVDPENW